MGGMSSCSGCVKFSDNPAMRRSASTARESCRCPQTFSARPNDRFASRAAAEAAAICIGCGERPVRSPSLMPTPRGYGCMGIRGEALRFRVPPSTAWKPSRKHPTGAAIADRPLTIHLPGPDPGESSVTASATAIDGEEQKNGRAMQLLAGLSPPRSNADAPRHDSRSMDRREGVACRGSWQPQRALQLVVVSGVLNEQGLISAIAEFERDRTASAFARPSPAERRAANTWAALLRSASPMARSQVVADARAADGAAAHPEARGRGLSPYKIARRAGRRRATSPSARSSPVGGRQHE